MTILIHRLIPSALNGIPMLKKRFRKLALEFHPDKHGGDGQKFIYLKNCYDVLKKNF